MLIGKKINLSLEEKFNLFIKNRISNSYINDDGALINVFSSSKVINKELLNKGINYKNKNIEDLILEVNILITNGFIEQNRRADYYELEILKSCLLEVAFYIYDYQYVEMTVDLQKEFNNIKQFSHLMRKKVF